MGKCLMINITDLKLIDLKAYLWLVTSVSLARLHHQILDRSPIYGECSFTHSLIYCPLKTVNKHPRYYKVKHPAVAWLISHFHFIQEIIEV